MECTCPYAEDSNCKHMAAVLYCLKSGNIPIKEKSNEINIDEDTDFESFKKEFRRNRYSLFHNKTYLHDYELNDYIDLINDFIKISKKYVNVNNLLAYKIFEYFLLQINDINVYDAYGKKEKIFETLFEDFCDIFEDEKIFVNLLAFVGTIYTIRTDEFCYDYRENILNLLCDYINFKWQAEDTLILLRKLKKDKNIYDYEKNLIVEKEVFINYNFINKSEALEMAKNNLQIKSICKFLLDLYKDDEMKQVELLNKMISANKGSFKDIYYKKLLAIYKSNNNEEYMKLLKKYFIDCSNIDIYREIRKSYTSQDWLEIRLEYLKLVKYCDLYREICVEEEYYDLLLESLKDDWIENVNMYLGILIKNKPKEVLELYKDKLINNILCADSRKMYQKILNNFNNLFIIPEGKKELEKIIDYVRMNFKNRKALQEELDFYEETYM